MKQNLKKFTTRILTALVASFGLSVANAADWSGTTSTDWNTGSNWSGNAVPTGENAIVNNTSGNTATINGNLSFTPNDIIVRNGSRIDHLAGVAGTGGGSYMWVENGVYNLANTASAGGISGYGQGTGSLNANSNLLVGAWGDDRIATMNVNTTGTFAVSGELFFGDSARSRGALNLESGTMTVNNKIFIGNNQGTGTVTMGGSGSTGASFITGQNNSNPFVINTPDSGLVVIGANGAGSGFFMSGGITLNGNLTLQTFDNTISGTTKAVTVFTGGITGTGNLLLNNLGLAANTISITTATVNHSGSITVQGSATGVTLISASIGSNVTGITQNSATSRLDLSGANTYAGNLTVNAGVVRISNNSNTGNDVSTVTLAASGATLNLTYVGTDTVDELYIGSTQQANGVYGKVGSALPVIGISQITGDGTLTVSSGPGGYSSWITGTFANGTVPALQQGANADPDNDGISNLLEYAIAGQDPTVANAAVGTFAANVLSYTKRAGTNGLTYAIQKSTDLGTTDPWIEVTGGSYVNDATTISYTLTPGTPAKNFLRLKVLSN